MISKQAIAITEKQILHYFSEHPSEDIMTLDFISSLASDYQNILIELYTLGLEPIREHLLKYAPPSITMEIINVILDTEYQESKISKYLKDLQTYVAIERINNTIVKDIGKELSATGDKDLEKLQRLNQELALNLKELEDKDEEEKEYLTYSEMAEAHKEVIIDRSNDIRQTTGCPSFDTLMPSVYPGMSFVCGYSGSAKSTWVHYMIENRIIRRQPTGLINTELSKPSFMDATLAPLGSIDYKDLMGLDMFNDNIDYQEILEKVDSVQQRFANNTNFLYYNGSKCNIETVEKFIDYCRKSMNLNKKTILFLFIDLVSMMEEFNKSVGGYNKAEVITMVLDKLNEMCLSKNVHLIGTVQLKRTPDVAQIKQVEDIDKFRPTLSEIKSSGAWEERARAIYLIHNPWSIVHKNPCSEVLKETIEPIIELTKAKDTYIGQAGETIKYLYISKYKKFVPYTEEY